MIKILIKGNALDLPDSFSLDVEDTNPIFNDRGSQSIPATIPATRRNIRLLDAPHRIDAGTDPNNPERIAEITSGAYMRRGTMNITEASKTDGITFNLGFDNSTAYAKWSQRQLSALSDLPIFMPPDEQGYPIDLLLGELDRIYRYPNPATDDFAIFPLAINNESTGTDNDTEADNGNKKIYWEILNLRGSHGFLQPGHIARLIDGTVTSVTIPEGYCVSPFLRVWRVLELIFSDLGVTVLDNPFKSDPELARLVVLNNAADVCCPGSIKYAELMPDCTVEEFLNSLWVRFGLVYNINNNTNTVSMRLLKDVITQRHGIALEAYATNSERITYNERQYIKLSAKTSIDGAEPSHGRFEDFARGFDIHDIHMGKRVDSWQNTGTPDDPRWDGDNSTSGSNTTSVLAREFGTGKWYKLDATNSAVRATSSGFFNWDPQPEGLSALELVSDDECVPIDRISNADTGTGYLFEGLCPLYLFGARHYHSYIKGSDDADNTGDETPLAFMFAYTVGEQTIGRLNGEGDDGKLITLDDGTQPSVSLLFQFKDGLFANYWKSYDEILRHGNRSVEIGAQINKVNLTKLDILSMFSFKGIRCLIDTLAYSLPASAEVSATITLRTMQTQGIYDIIAEQNIPDFAAAVRKLEWKLVSETYGNTLDTTDARSMAVAKFRQQSGYQDHGTQGDFWFISSDSVRLNNMNRALPVWQSDPALAAPSYYGETVSHRYKAVLYYDVYEVHDLSAMPGDNDFEMSESPIGSISVEVDYFVRLVAIGVS